ncbi:hypothetical protein Hypma_005713 [Hypsizygus marmoreus]|uniref:Uncharacterized protein n=1 Tax=Hypsizygus marmoreus TaxID=39966 RepID=A0A369KIW1_HYPMA|nr:hypothetical protein Hypma_005713 [Hypsizygus marmoreus]
MPRLADPSDIQQEPSSNQSAEIHIVDAEMEEEDSPLPKSGKKGPGNTSCEHFKDPVPIYTVNKAEVFKDEPTQPSLSNLATHLCTKHANIEKLPMGASEVMAGIAHEVNAASAKIMEGYLKEGLLNPSITPTQKGFYKVFAAWILEDDLPFTAGETSGIHQLFKYMQSHFQLPSDTTVRNTLT